ncbi:MAG: DNA polymerase III subunit delta [Betaproteobacteria bacterium]|jgi:DNA polymerase-3 subunit delta
MAISTEELAQQLKRNSKTLFVVVGDELLLNLEAGDLIRQHAKELGCEERTILIADSRYDWSKLREEGQSLSLFSTKRLIDLRIPSGKPGKNGSEAITQFCENLPADTITLVSLPGLDRNTLKSKWYLALEKYGLIVQANKIYREQLPRWIAQRLQLQNQNADRDVLQMIADRVEGNLMAAHQEIQKLGLLLPAGKINLDDVTSAVTDVARFDVFDLGPTILKQDRTQFLRMMDGLESEGVAAPLVLWAINEESRALLRVQLALANGASMNDAVREARVWGLRQKLLPRAAQLLSRSIIERAILLAAEIDRQIKGLRRGDPWEGLRNLGITLIPQR